MRKTNVFVLVAFILTAVFLIGILVVGLQSDGFSVFTSQASNANEAAQSRPEKGSENTPVRSEANRETGNRQNTYEYTYSTEKVNGLRIDWISGEVDIEVKSDISEIKITEFASRSLSEDEVLELSSEDGLLRVDWNKDLVQLGFLNGYNKNLLVELPQEFADEMSVLKVDTTSAEIDVSGLTEERVFINTASGDVELEAVTGEETEIDTASGSVDLKGIRCEKLMVNTVSGKIDGEDHRVDVLEVNSTSGSIEFEGEYKEINASTISGKIEIEDDICPEDAEFSSVSGTIMLNIPENKGFEVSYESLSGQFQTEFGNSSGKSGRMVYGDGTASFRFSTTSGNINIGKNK